MTYNSCTLLTAVVHEIQLLYMMMTSCLVDKISDQCNILSDEPCTSVFMMRLISQQLCGRNIYFYLS